MLSEQAQEAPGRAARVLRPRRRLPHRRARPGDPRRRQPAGRRAERPHRRGGHRDLSQAAGGDGARAARRERRGGAVGGPRPAGADVDPSEYVDDANLRMELYRKIAEEPEREMLAELVDRFGPPPASVQTLVEVAALKRLAESLRVQSISAKAGELVIRLRRDARIDVERLIEMVSTIARGELQPHRRAVAARRRRPAARGRGAADAGVAGNMRSLRPALPRLRASSCCRRLPAAAPPAPRTPWRASATRTCATAISSLPHAHRQRRRDGVLGSDVLSQLFDQFLEERLLARLAADRKVVREAEGRPGSGRRSRRSGEPAAARGRLRPRSRPLLRGAPAGLRASRAGEAAPDPDRGPGDGRAARREIGRQRRSRRSPAGCRAIPGRRGRLPGRARRDDLPPRSPRSSSA